MLDLEKLEELPLKETHRTAFLKNDVYGDEFKKSANKFLGRGFRYAHNVLRKYIDKPVKGLIPLLRSQSKSKHTSFKKAVEIVIKYNLMHRPDYLSSWNRDQYYVDADGFLRTFVKKSYRTVYTPLKQDTFTKDGKFFTIINGTHFFVNEAYYKRKTTYFYSYNFAEEYILSKQSVVIKQLSKKELKNHSLVNEGV